jgi:uncharacterized protein (DUF1778 family)
MQDFLLNKMESPKIGRPTLSEDEKQGKITAVRLRDEERGLLEKAAAVHGKRLSEWMRDVLVSSAKRQLRNEA